MIDKELETCILWNRAAVHNSCDTSVLSECVNAISGAEAPMLDLACAVGFVPRLRCSPLAVVLYIPI
jgi:hypothetical protein